MSKKNKEVLCGADHLKENFEEYQNHVRLIQKNVRGWLLRRQYLDICHATRTLQNYIRGKFIKKEMAQNCNLIIQNKVKDWLTIKPK